MMQCEVYGESRQEDSGPYVVAILAMLFVAIFGSMKLLPYAIIGVVGGIHLVRAGASSCSIEQLMRRMTMKVSIPLGIGSTVPALIPNLVASRFTAGFIAFAAVLIIHFAMAGRRKHEHS